jgi:hypothetical protein
LESPRRFVAPGGRFWTRPHVLAFDNVSGLPAWISDTVCRLATGGGFAVASSIPIRTKCCSTPPAGDRSRISSQGRIWPIARCSSGCADPRRAPPPRTGIYGQRSRPSALVSSACCSTRRASQSCRIRRSTSCRAWRISHCGHRRAKPRFGPPAPSDRPIAAIATKRWKASLMLI